MKLLALSGRRRLFVRYVFRIRLQRLSLDFDYAPFSLLPKTLVAAPAMILDGEVLRRQFAARFAHGERGAAFTVEVVDSIPSTNARLLSNARQSASHFLIARQQTAGVGRRGGVWQSPPSGNLYLSYCFHTSLSLSVVALLPLAFGVEIAREIESVLGISIQLKWPNDLYLDGKKCGGLLLETKALEDDVMALVVGVGVNVASHPSQTLLGRPVTSLQSVLDEPISSERVAIAVMAAIKVVSELKDLEISALLTNHWSTRDLLLEQKVTVSQAAGAQVTGIARGIAADGGLQVDCGGRVETFYAGEVSLGHVGPVDVVSNGG